MMKFGIFIFIVGLLAISPARACTPPVFTVPPEVSAALQAREAGTLSSSDQFLLESYEKDRNRYLEVYEQLYPCAVFAAQLESVEIPQEQQETLRQELVLIERKWSQQGVTAKNIEAAEEFVDVPEDAFMAVE